MRYLLDLAAFFLCTDFCVAVDTFFDIEAQKRSRVTKLGAQTQYRVVLRFFPASKQSEIMCARDKCVVFQNIGRAISDSTDQPRRSSNIIFLLSERIYNQPPEHPPDRRGKCQSV